MNSENCLRDCSVERSQNKTLSENFAREIEDIWGYAKRLRFVRDVIGASFTGPAGSLLLWSLVDDTP